VRHTHSLAGREAAPAGETAPAGEGGPGMRIVRTVAELREALASERRAGRTIGLVPTMGSFHEGHLSLIRRARVDCEVVVVSLFVNPTQFAPTEDLATYPRDERRDAGLADAEGVDLLFAPADDEVYPDGFDTTVTVGGVASVLEGDPARRGPGHFAGVATIVTKLFNMVGPDVAYFGQKDAQQAVVIRSLVRDLDIPVRIEICPTVRDPDGLALSSRNGYLSSDERARALALSRALRAAEAAVDGGERDGAAVLRAARVELDGAGIEPEYLELRSTYDLSPVERVNGSTLLAVAARIGKARLIDNVILGADQEDRSHTT
jgi:pantoate--beta-alanine ligase